MVLIAGIKQQGVPNLQMTGIDQMDQVGLVFLGFTNGRKHRKT